MSPRVRTLTFGPRSSLPTSAACVVANGVRETLASLFGTTVTLRLFEPAIPAPPAWRSILRNAALYRVRGSVTDAAIVLRSADAVALAGGLFGETDGPAGERELSRIERDLLDRTANAIAAHLGSVCGTRDGHRAESVGEIGGCATYFELLLEEPVEARIGIALSRDPSPEPRVCVEVGHLANVPVTVRATLDMGRVPTAAVARLAPDALMPVRFQDVHRCTLIAHGRTLARGTCGVRNGRFAFSVESIRGSL